MSAVIEPGDSSDAPKPEHRGFPAWLQDPLIIGYDTMDNRALAVGLYWNAETYTDEDCPINAKHLKGKRIPHNHDGLPWLIKATSCGTWISMRHAYAEEIAKYDALVLAAMHIEGNDFQTRPPYPKNQIPPFPCWFEDGIIVFDGPDDESPNMNARVAVGRNGRDGYMWVIKSLDSNEWFSYRYARLDDIVRYDDAFLAANRVVGSFPRLLQKVNPPVGYGSDV